MKTIDQLISQFQAYEYGRAEALTLAECEYLLSNEEQIDFSLYQDVMNFRDHLELELE